jgi:hypothetical protein
MAEWKPRKVASNEERGMYSSEYIKLGTGEKFVGYALFNGDLDKPEPGYYEFWYHYLPSLGRGTSFACPGADVCPVCQDGDPPKTRAKTAWLVTQLNDKTFDPPKVATFDMSAPIINDFAARREEGDKVLGQQFRIMRPEERRYSSESRPQSITAKEVKEHLKNIKDYGQQEANKLKRVMETLMTERALTADPDEPARPVREPEEKPKAAKASKVGKRPNWPEETEEPVEVVIIEADSTGFVVSSEDFEGDTYVYITGDMDVSDLEDGQDVMIRYYTDDDNDKVLHDAPQPVEAEPESTNGIPSEFEDVVFVVTGLDEEQNIIHIESDELGYSLPLYVVADAGSVDEYAAGDKIRVTAEKDPEGDMLSKVLPDKVAATKQKKGAK